MWKVLLRQLLLITVLLPITLFSVNAIVASLVSQSSEAYSQRTFVGALKTLEQELYLPVPENEAQLQQNLGRLQQSLGELKLSIHALDEFPPAEVTVLKQQKLLDLSDPDRLAWRMKDGRVLVLQTPSPPSQLNAIIVVWLVTLLIVALLLYLLQVRPFWRDLQNLRSAAKRLGDGDLATRIVGIRRSSSLMPLAERMNQMAEQIEQLVAGQRELLNAVAHELRTPLARAFFALDLQEGKSAEQIGLLQQKLRDDLEDMDELITELLGYGKLDSREALQLTTVQLNPLLNQLQSDYAHQGTRIELAAENNLTAQADERLLRHVLDNLLKNACRHAQSRVWLSASRRGDTVCLIVEDDGLGIAEIDRERIFEPFVRLDESRSRDTGGVGLGLALVKRIAQRHQGQVWVETGLRQGGAKFVFEWVSA